MLDNRHRIYALDSWTALPRRRPSEKRIKERIALGVVPAKSLISMVGAQGLEPWTR